MILAHITAIMPATFAFWASAGRYPDRQFLGLVGVYHSRLGCHEDQSKVVSQRVEKMKVVPGSVYLDPGCKRGSNFSGSTYLFKLPLYMGA
jgi:hypothetical protein